MNHRSLVVKSLIFSLSILSVALPAAGQKILVPDAPRNVQPGSGTDVPQTNSAETPSSLHKRNWRYRVNPSDVLELTFALTPEFDQTVTVQPDGYITLRAVGDLSAAGQTLPELTQSLKTAYSKILKEPEIAIDPKEFEKPFFTVGGQVGKPGKFDWYSDITLTQAIAIA